MHDRGPIITGATLALLAALPGCAAGPDYHSPDSASLGVPASYSAALPGQSPSAPASDAELGAWWRQLGDPLLSAFVDRAIASNLDIAQAAARLTQARESLRQASADFLPTVSASASGGRNFRSGGTGFQTDANGNVISTSSGGSSNAFSLGADASWQIDLFGAIGRSVEASRGDLAASGYTLASVRTAIITELVTNYVNARLAQERLAIARDTLKTAQDNYDIARWRVQAGLVSSLDAEQARAQLAQQSAAIPQIEQILAGNLNRIAVLTGDAPGEATRALETAAPIPTPPPAPSAGIPADTLRQRPDVRASERALAAATARIGVAQAALYPSLNLSGSISTSATTIGSLTDIVTGSAFARIAQLIFDGGAAQSRVRAQRAAAQGAFAAYRQNVLTALEDVENAIVADRSARTRAEQLAIAYDAANNSAILARSQYRSGLIDFQTLLNTEQSLLSARDGFASARADKVSAVVQLYSALGGGWQTMDGRPQ